MKLLHHLFLLFFLESSVAWVVPTRPTTRNIHDPIIRNVPVARLVFGHPKTPNFELQGASSFQGETSATSCRRFFLSSITTSIVVSAPWLLYPTQSSAAEGQEEERDLLLNQFGMGLSSPTSPIIINNNNSKQQQSSKWPDSPSPLPTSKKSAQELTQELENAKAAAAALDPSEEELLSDMQQALQQSAKKKQIGPRTHG